MQRISAIYKSCVAFSFSKTRGKALAETLQKGFVEFPLAGAAGIIRINTTYFFFMLS